MDPWWISPEERARHQGQFASLNPVGGFITGAQAKGFLMQSGLPPMVLAQIWGVADMNGDGKMDLNEFSIACKLITNKLKGHEVPKTLPPQMMVAAAPPSSLPVSSMAMPPMSTAPGMMPQMMQPGMMPQPGMMQQPGMMAQPGMMPAISQAGMMTQPAGMMMPPQSQAAPMMAPQVQPGMMPRMPGAQMMQQPMMQPGMVPPAQGMVPGMPAGIPASSVGSVGTGSASHSGASTPLGVGMDWAVPQLTRQKYMATFSQTDRARTGFIAGIQARNILIQSGLPQPILAQIWSLSDVDGDGRLSAEEFILSGYLCDLAQKGEPLPPALPPNLIPPTLRKGKPAGAGSEGVGTPGSVKSVEQDVGSPSTFEDKRRENFNKGQAELEKRRQSLIDQQKKEEEERKRKEKEEAEKKEQQRLEIERRRFAEIERQRQHQWELKRQAEEQKRQAEEQRRAARQEMERQRLAEWEKQRKAELTQHRQREQEKVITLKARQENLNKDLDHLREKVKTLTTDISDTRSGVTDVKSFIDGMRTSRDEKMKDMNGLKAQLKDQNNRLLIVTQEKAKLEAKNRANAEKIAEGKGEEISEFELKKQEKLKHVEELREKLKVLKEKEEEKRTKYEEDKALLNEHRDQLKKIIESCKELYDKFDDKRREVKAEKAKRIRELTDPNHAWSNEPQEEAEPEPGRAGVIAPVEEAGGYVKYRAMYDFEPTNPDELAFNVGDIILVHPGQDHEPGWLGGELNGKVGWFPEAYVERADELQTIVEEGAGAQARALHDWDGGQANQLPLRRGDIVVVQDKTDPDWWFGTGSSGAQGYFPSNFVAPDALEARGTTPTDAPAPPASAVPGGAAPAEEGERCISLFQYVSDEPGDLTFDVGEIIHVVQKAGDWWTGKIGDRVGVFPFNYVQPAPQGESSGKGAKKPEIATVMAPYEATSKEQLSLQRGQMILVRKRTETGWWQGEIQGGKGKKRQIGWFPASYVKLMSEGGDKESSAPPPEASPAPAKDQYRALFAYAGQHGDELAFQAGDVITLISKDEEAWWKGECNGQVGVFPSNYVEPVEEALNSPTDNETRRNLIQELFTTEHSYLENLLIVHDVFMVPIAKSKDLTEEEMQIIFINWKDLMLCSIRFYKSLKIRRKMNAGKQCITIGDILCENLPQMTAYIRFCASQLTAAALLQKLVELKPGFDGFLRQCQMHQKVQGMPLSYFLLKPVKRVTEYPLIIEKLIKHTPPSHPDSPYLIEALEKARSLCNQVNEGMREKENSERLEWLQLHFLQTDNDPTGLDEKITFNSVTNSVGPRRFLHHGLLHKSKSGKEIVAFLFNDFLLLTLPNKSLGQQQFSFDKHHDIKLKLYKKPIFLSELSLDSSGRKTPSGDHQPSPTSLMLQVGSQVQLAFEALSVNDRTLWAQKLNDAIRAFAKNEQAFMTRQDSVRTEEQNAAMGRLLVIVVEAEDLHSSGANFHRLANKGNVRLVILSASQLNCPKHKGKIDPYCDVSMGSQKTTTQVVPNTCNPKWNASMQFLVKDLEQDVLCLTVFDKDYFSPNEFLGRTEIRVSDIVAEKDERGPVTKKLPLQESESGMITVRIDLQIFQH